MVKSIDTLVPDIQALFVDGRNLEATIEKFSSDIGKMFVSRFKGYAEEYEPTLRMSNIGKPDRQLYYELTGVKKDEELPVSAKIKFLYGDLLESLLLYLAVEAGHNVSLLQAEADVDGVKGHIDAVIDGWVVDAKSASTYSYNKILSKQLLDDDPFGYMYQLVGYKDHFKLPVAHLIIDKVLGHIALVQYTEEELSAYNAKNRIQHIRGLLSSSDPPPRCYEPVPVSKKDSTGNLCLGVGCSYCNRKFTCWADSNDGAGLQTRIYSTGPKYFVKLVKEPNLKYKQKTFEDFEKKDA